MALSNSTPSTVAPSAGFSPAHPRKKESKKYGLKARKAPQYSKLIAPLVELAGPLPSVVFGR